MFAKQSVRLHEKDDDQDGEHNGVRQLGRDIGL